MNRTPSYHFVFFPPDGKALRKVVDKEQYASLAQNDVLCEVELDGIKHIITKRRTFNRFDSLNADFFLIMDIILKPE